MFDENERKRKLAKLFMQRKIKPKYDTELLRKAFMARASKPTLLTGTKQAQKPLFPLRLLRTKTYIAFDGDADLMSYRTIQGWSKDPSTAFSLNDAHDINYARDDSLPESICQQLKKRLDVSKNFVLIIGSKTNRNRKGILQYEMRYALRNKLPIILVFKGYSEKNRNTDILWKIYLQPNIPKAIRDYNEKEKFCLICPFTQLAVTGAIRLYSNNNLPNPVYTWHWK